MNRRPKFLMFNPLFFVDIREFLLPLYLLTHVTHVTHIFVEALNQAFPKYVPASVVQAVEERGMISKGSQPMCTFVAALGKFCLRVLLCYLFLIALLFEHLSYFIYRKTI